MQIDLNYIYQYLMMNSRINQKISRWKGQTTCICSFVSYRLVD